MSAIFSILTVTAAILCCANGEESKQHILVDGLVNDENCPDSSINMNMKVSRVDRTTYKINGKAEYKEDLTKDMILQATVFKQLGAKHYITTGISFQGNLCESLLNDKDFWPKIAESGDLPTACPFPKGTYSVNDAVLMFDKVPPGFDQGCYKTNVRVLKGIEKHGCYNVMFRITDKEGKAPGKCQK